MQHTVIMPFNRPKNFQTLREHMEGQGVTWVPLYDSDECRKLFANVNLGDWIKPWYGDLPRERETYHGEGVAYEKGPPTVNPGHWMCDAFLDGQIKADGGLGFFRPDHYVSFMTDDCLWNWNYWRKLQRHFCVKRTVKGTGGEVSPAVIISAHRSGANIIYPRHRSGNQPFHESSCTTFCTRFEALTVRADKLRDVRFGSFWAGDGIVVERLVEENFDGGYVEFAPEAMVYFNALSPEAYGFPSTHQR